MFVRRTCHLIASHRMCHFIIVCCNMLELGKTTKEYIFSNFRVNIYKQPTKDLILHVAMLLNVFKIVYIVSEC
jgi:hypothetical protein